MDQEVAFEFEATTSFVELRFPDGTILHVNRKSAESGIANTATDHAALDMLAFNNPLAYIQLMLRGNPRKWLKHND